MLQVMCTRRRVIAAWMLTALILAAVSSHFFGIVTYPLSLFSPETNSTVDVDPICYVMPVHQWFFDHAWYWIDCTLLALVPFVVVLTGNCVMVTCVVRAVRFRYRQETYLPGPRGGSSAAAAGDKGKAVTSSTVMLMTLSVSVTESDERLNL